MTRDTLLSVSWEVSEDFETREPFPVRIARGFSNFHFGTEGSSFQ